MRALLACLVIVLIHCTLSSSFKIKKNYIDVHQIGENELSVMQQLPPQDPAVHDFPTVPTVPLIPTCVKEGYFRDPFNCRKFYYCSHANAAPKGFYCQSGLIFNTVNNYCDNPKYVEC